MDLDASIRRLVRLATLVYEVNSDEMVDMQLRYCPGLDEANAWKLSLVLPGHSEVVFGRTPEEAAVAMAVIVDLDLAVAIERAERLTKTLRQASAS